MIKESERVPTNRRTRKEGFTDLLSQPSQVERPDVASVELDNSGERVVEPLDESDDRRLSGSRRANEGCSLSCGEMLKEKDIPRSASLPFEEAERRTYDGKTLPA